jgi:hypothetical protein
MTAGEKSDEIHKLCINCGRKISQHPSTGRFHTIILHSRECAWNPDKEFKGFVTKTLKNSGYNLEAFGHERLMESQ